MTHQTRAGIGLIRLGDSDFVPANPEQDIRGKDVYDAEGQRIGSVGNLYIERKEREVRFLEVGAGASSGWERSTSWYRLRLSWRSQRIG
jgi:sporulation protein YlmC with PRC-barrel domain